MRKQRNVTFDQIEITLQRGHRHFLSANKSRRGLHRFLWRRVRPACTPACVRACLCGCSISSSRAAQGNTDLCKYLARALCFIASRPAKTFPTTCAYPSHRSDRPKIFNYFFPPPFFDFQLPSSRRPVGRCDAWPLIIQPSGPSRKPNPRWYRCPSDCAIIGCENIFLFGFRITNNC